MIKKNKLKIHKIQKKLTLNLIILTLINLVIFAHQILIKIIILNKMLKLSHCKINNLIKMKTCGILFLKIIKNNINNNNYKIMLIY
jgi:hypothetical protein